MRRPAFRPDDILWHDALMIQGTAGFFVASILCASTAWSQQTISFRQGENGYSGTLDTWINQNSPNSSYGNDGTRWVDDDVPNSIFSDYRGQALLRFDGIIADAAIPPGSTIVSATLEIHVVEDIDTPFWNPFIDVYPVVRAWDEGSSWNSLDGGLSQPQDLAPRWASFNGDNEPEDNSLKLIGVTGLVQAWADGQPNWGVAFLPEIISGNDDGIEIATSEWGTVGQRPKLTVTFIPPEPPPPPPIEGDFNADGVVDGIDLGLILGAWGTNVPDYDLNNDGVVGGYELAFVLGLWS
jgi:hypothetical protein